VELRFSRHLPNASNSKCLLAKLEKNSPRGGKKRRKKTLTKLASKLKKITRQFQILLAFGELTSGYFHP
jgi:hypothetical protein